LNTAFAEGVYINIPKANLFCRNHVFLNWSEALMVQPRNLNCRWKFTCSNYWTPPKLKWEPVLTNSVTEIFAQKNERRLL
jgi:hypothetical protein